MGEVYRATDANLGRPVAIKVLPDAFAQDSERLPRFEPEAKTLASLNHPHIAQIYGFEKAAGIRTLVMELVEGPTLADRIAQGRFRLMRRSRSGARSPKRWKPHTSKASFTGI
jgi:serine/threonine protein kinase